MSPALKGTAATSIIERMKTVRAELRMSQEDFAELIGVTRNHVARFETGRSEPSLTAIVGVLVIDLRIAGEPMRPIDPTWLLLGPDFEKDMWGKIRHGLIDMPMDDRWELAQRAQNG